MPRKIMQAAGVGGLLGAFVSSMSYFAFFGVTNTDYGVAVVFLLLGVLLGSAISTGILKQLHL
ncbi:MAG: hypothetical protein GOV15_00635 [Candidatus Diapherotrites archaeon]|nr:hypothetical protein [Candidatus Diapherotrites archaeon]